MSCPVPVPAVLLYVRMLLLALLPNRMSGHSAVCLDREGEEVERDVLREDCWDRIRIYFFFRLALNFVIECPYTYLS